MPERAVIAMFITNQIAGRVPLVMGCGGNSTSEVLDQLREFDLRGADAILSVTPITTNLRRRVSTSISAPSRSIRPCR